MRQGFLILLEMRNLRLRGVKSCLLTNGCAVILTQALLLCCFVLRIVEIMRYPGRADERGNTTRKGREFLNTMGTWQDMTGNEESTHALLVCYLQTEDLETSEMDLKNKDRCQLGTVGRQQHYTVHLEERCH